MPSAPLRSLRSAIGNGSQWAPHLGLAMARGIMSRRGAHSMRPRLPQCAHTHVARLLQGQHHTPAPAGAEARRQAAGQGGMGQGGTGTSPTRPSPYPRTGLQGWEYGEEVMADQVGKRGWSASPVEPHHGSGQRLPALLTPLTLLLLFGRHALSRAPPHPAGTGRASSTRAGGWAATAASLRCVLTAVWVGAEVAQVGACAWSSACMPSYMCPPPDLCVCASPTTYDLSLPHTHTRLARCMRSSFQPRCSRACQR